MSAVVILILRALFTLALFAFLGWVVYVLWKDLQSIFKKSTDFDIHPLDLFIIDSGLTHSFSQPEFFIGRDPQADLQINDDTLSALHARFFYKNGHWMVEDLQSTNGTLLNEDRLSTPSVLIEGDEITCGQVRMLVNIKQA